MDMEQEWNSSFAGVMKRNYGGIEFRFISGLQCNDCVVDSGINMNVQCLELIE